MAARIFQRSKNAMQSGKATANEWILQFESHRPHTPDPLTGWSGGGDTQSQVTLRFPTMDAAKAYAERNAINAPIQGSAADVIKLAMVRIFQRFEDEGLRSKMILQVHDELNFNVYRNEAERVKQIVLEEMERVMPLRVPLIADCGEGKNWLEAH